MTEHKPTTAIYALTGQGLTLALRLRQALGGVCFAPRSLAGNEGGPQDAGPNAGPGGGLIGVPGDESGVAPGNGTPGDAPDGEFGGVRGFASLSALLHAQFGNFRQHIFIAATGIVVRCLAPLLAHKTVDPAVVVLDHKGEFVISLLAGHLGGANTLARRVAALTGGRAVITTATDTEGLPAVDLLAARAGLHIHNPEGIRVINAALLAGKHIALHDAEGWLWPGLTPAEQEHFQVLNAAQNLEDLADLTGLAAPYPPLPLLRVTWQAFTPPENCLGLIPPALCLGVGCRKGAAAREILDLVHAVCADNGLALAAIACLASADIKAAEPGLLEAAKVLGVPLRTFSAAELAAYPPQRISPKAASALGLPGVCEPAARCAARGGPLLVGKQTLGRVTLAVARRLPEATGQ